MKGYGLTAAAEDIKGSNYSINAKALRVLRILVVPLIVKIFLDDFVDDLVDPVCEGILTLRDTDSCSLCFRSTLKYRFGRITRLLLRGWFQI